jgi:transcriptional regulator with XRE-family HTH domain
VGAFETGRMNITLASLHLVAQTLGVRIVDLFKGVEREKKPASRKPLLR